MISETGQVKLRPFLDLTVSPEVRDDVDGFESVCIEVIQSTMFSSSSSPSLPAVREFAAWLLREDSKVREVQTALARLVADGDFSAKRRRDAGGRRPLSLVDAIETAEYSLRSGQGSGEEDEEDRCLRVRLKDLRGIVLDGLTFCAYLGDDRSNVKFFSLEDSALIPLSLRRQTIQEETTTVRVAAQGRSVGEGRIALSRVWNRGADRQAFWLHVRDSKARIVCQVCVEMDVVFRSEGEEREEKREEVDRTVEGGKDLSDNDSASTEAVIQSLRRIRGALKAVRKRLLEDE